MANYAVDIQMRDIAYSVSYGPRGVIEIEVLKGDPAARKLAKRRTYIYCHMLETDYVRRPDGSLDTNQKLRRHVQNFRMTPEELFALADYVKSQLHDNSPEDAVSVETTK